MNTENQVEEFEYQPELATKLILETISEELKNKLDSNDIMKILELQEEYYKLIGVIPGDNDESLCDYPIEVNEDAMNHFIITNAVRFDIVLTTEEMGEIMNAEALYLELNSQIDEPTHLN